MWKIAPVLVLLLASCGASGPCCKECTASKPCGDSCIPSGSTCRKGAGCACTVEEATAESSTG